MFPLYRRIDCFLAILAIFCLLSACSTTRPAYLQPQSHIHLRTAPADLTVSSSDTTPTRTVPEVSSPTVIKLVSDLTGLVSSTATKPIRSNPAKQAKLAHLNPDSYALQRLNRLNGSPTIAHVALRSQLIDRHSLNRKTYKPAFLALGLALLSYMSLFFTGGSTLLWVLSITLPLGSTLLGTASLLTINRNKDRYRGKGWAMAAIVVGTGALGLALMAVAALSVSKIVWEK